MRAIIWVAVSTSAQADEDKSSLPEQEAAARAIADKHNWRVIDTLRVPGHSRRYIDINECAADMRAGGIDAFDKLLDHWNAKDFDVLVCRDGSRFARTQTLHSYIVERTIDMGARIYSLQDGWIDRQNYRMWISMAGYTAAGQVDQLVKARDLGMSARARRGLPVSPTAPLGYKIIRDEMGNAVQLVVDEDKRRLFDDVEKLLLEGVPWGNIEHELYHRFGHVDPDTGKPYRRLRIYGVLFTPTFWGHVARRYRLRGDASQYASWMFDQTEPPPEGVEIYYNVHECMYTGDQAERVKAEIRRRKIMVGKRRPGTTHRFAGLIVCGDCGKTLAANGKLLREGRGYYRCKSRWLPNVDCDNNRTIKEVEIVDWFDARLRQMVAANRPTFQDEIDEPYDPTSDIQADIESITEQLRKLIQKQATAPDDLHMLYDDEISALHERRRILQRALQSQPRDVSGERRAALDELIDISVERFWDLPSHKINQILLRLLGDTRLVANDGEIVGMVTV